MNEDAPLPTKDAYKRAFQLLQDARKITRGQMAMLRYQFLSEDRAASARQLAHAAGYRGHASGNLHYGKLGVKLREVIPDGHLVEGQESYILSYLLPPGEAGNEEWLFVMYEPVAAALDELGWFREG
ncbi:MAG: hypothetical protein L6R30_15925 [Thermoanaerobaculia bacterium]|nr:hypothetical protein [Thermoanaerobaculia bacterium]